MTSAQDYDSQNRTSRWVQWYVKTVQNHKVPLGQTLATTVGLPDGLLDNWVVLVILFLFCS